MTLPRVRFTVRRMMAAVAVVAIFMGTCIWSFRLPALAAKYRRLANSYEFSKSYYKDPSIGPPDPKDQAVVINYLEVLRKKYDEAARHPWWLLDKDAPEPVEADKWGLKLWIDPDEPEQPADPRFLGHPPRY